MALTIDQGRIAEFIAYHHAMQDIDDIDPSYNMLKYVSDRFELNIEQRYWLAFLYSTCYNASTVFYIYNEFPDYLGVDVGRLQRWWDNNRNRIDFQTDCRWVRSRNQFVQMFVEYRYLCGDNQQRCFKVLGSYDSCYRIFEGIHNFGRFKLFLLLEAVHVVAGLPIEPDCLPLEQAESSRNGLCFALGRDDLLRGHEYGDQPISKSDYQYLYQSFEELLDLMCQFFPTFRIDYWNVETTLCAYKKWHRSKRYPGYYIDRQGKEIEKMAKQVPEGVCWDVLWQFREETYPRELLWEKTGHDNKNYDKFWRR